MQTQKQYDIAVVGAGPAGATFARLVGRDRRILLLDGAAGGKPCGGLLSPDAQRALARFDLTLPKEILVDPQIFAVRTVDLKTGAERYYQRLYINLNREKFDRWLLSLLPDNVELVKGRCVGIEKTADGFEIAYVDENGVRRLASAQTLVGADGASSIVRRRFFGDRKVRTYTAIQQWFPSEEGNPFYSCIFDPETSNCCSWSIHKDNYLIFGGAFALQDSRACFERQKAKLAAFGFRLGEPVKTEACLVYRPNRFRSLCCGSDGVYLIGEAAGFISPSSLEGISYAINSAVSLADSFSAKPSRRSAVYRRKTICLRLKLMLKTLKCPFMYTPFLRRIVMWSGLSSMRLHDGPR